MRRRFVPGEPGRNSRHQSHDIMFMTVPTTHLMNNINRLGKFL
jgi:hypothetical protein